MKTKVFWCYLLALLVLAVSWRSEGVQNKPKRLRTLDELDRSGLMMGEQKHSLVEEIAQQVSQKAISLPLSLSLYLSLTHTHTHTTPSHSHKQDNVVPFYHTASVQASVRQWFANPSW